MIGKIFIGCGTLGCKIISSLKQRVWDYQSDLVQFIGIDTHEDTPGLDKLNPEELILISNAPIEEIFQHPADYGELVNGIFLEQLTDHPTDLKQGGCLYPTVTNLAIRYYYTQIKNTFSHAIATLRDPENNLTAIDTWVIGSIASTTGRGILLEICILLKQLFKKYPGLTATLSTVIIGAQGLNPDKLQQRHDLEAGFWTEYNAAMESFPIPRPHAQNNTIWQGHVADYTFHVCTISQNFSLRSIEQVVEWTVEWLFHTIVIEEVRAELSGVRIRYRPQIAGYDRGQENPKRTFLSIAGFSALTEQLPDVRRYGKAQLALQVCENLLGDTPAETGELNISLDLHLASLQERLEYAKYHILITQEANRLAKRLEAERPKYWRGIVETSLVNAEQQIKSAQDLSPIIRKQLFTDLANRIATQLIVNTNGVRHIVKVLEDLRKHVEILHQQTMEELRNLKRIDHTRTQLIDNTKQVGWFNRFKMLDEIKEMFQKVADAVLIVLNDNIIRLLDDLNIFINSQLKTARAVVSRLETAGSILQEQSRAALVRTTCPIVDYLLTETDLKELASNILIPENVQLLKDTLIKRADDNGDLLGLIKFNPESIVEILTKQMKAQRYSAFIDSCQFSDYFNKKYQTDQAKEDFFRQLLERANAVGGTIDPGYSHKTRAIDSMADEQIRIFLPTSMMVTGEKILSRIAPWLQASSLISVNSLGLILATREIHHIPLYAQKYFRDIAAQLPRKKIERSKCLIAEWALQAESYVPHEFFETWNNRELLLLGRIFEIINQTSDSLIYHDPNIGIPVELGTFDKALHTLDYNGHRRDLVKLTKEALQAQSWSDCSTHFQKASENLPEHRTEIRPLYYKLKREYEDLDLCKK